MAYKILVMVFLLFLISCKKNQTLVPEDLANNSNNSSNGSGGGGGGGSGSGGSGGSDGLTGLTSGIVKVNTGDDHTCLLTADHKMLCAGDNGDNQAGAGIVSSRYDVYKPIDVTSLFPGKTIVDITAHADADCAIFSDRTAQCWGYNGDGELGIGTANDTATPQALAWFDGSSAEKRIKSLQLGEYLACALSEANSFYCWGNNYTFAMDPQADLLDPTQPIITEVTTPYPISFYDGSTPAKTVKEYHVGYKQICVLSEIDDFRCFGRLMDDNTGDVSTNVPLLRFGLDGSTPAKKVKNFSIGYSHICYVTDEQKVFCAGRNGQGKLGCGQTYDDMNFSSTPCQVLNDDNSPLEALSVTAGDYQTCAITLDHKVKCWGSGSDGAVGNGATLSVTKAVAVIKTDGSLLSDIQFLNSGVEAGHVCALNSVGTLYCWGDNGDGQLFLPANISAIPTLIPTNSVAKVGMGQDNMSYTCFIKKDGSVYCRNVNDYTVGTLSTPIDGSAGNSAIQLVQNWSHSCALLSNGAVNCWASDFINSPVAYFDLSDADHTATKIAQVGWNLCALTNGTLRCNNDYTIAGPNNIIDIAGNGTYVCTINTAHAVNCYTVGGFGSPIPVVNLDGSGELATQITINDNFGCVVTQSHKVSCWSFNDRNSYGYLGNGTTAASGITPFEANTVNVINGTTISANLVLSGADHVCAQMSNHDIYCWGENRNYQVTSSIIGSVDGEITVPTKVTDLPTGENFTLNVLRNASCVAGDTSGDLYCWGGIVDLGLSSTNDLRSRATLISL